MWISGKKEESRIILGLGHQKKLNKNAFYQNVESGGRTGLGVDHQVCLEVTSSFFVV